VKGHISPLLARILADREAARQLRVILTSDRPGRLTFEGKTYTVGSTARGVTPHKEKKETTP
jgi:hypothetical protein